jgi:hypothetical protein
VEVQGGSRRFDEAAGATQEPDPGQIADGPLVDVALGERWLAFGQLTDEAGDRQSLWERFQDAPENNGLSERVCNRSGRRARTNSLVVHGKPVFLCQGGGLLAQPPRRLISVGDEARGFGRRGLGNSQTDPPPAIPRWAKWKLSEIEPKDVRELLMAMRNDGLSTSMIRKTRASLSTLFATALEDGLIGTNPIRGVRIPAPLVEEIPDEERAKALTKDSRLFSRQYQRTGTCSSSSSSTPECASRR